MKEQADFELLLLARSGDKDAFGCLIERHQKLAYGLARRMVVNNEIARELVQEAMLQAYLSLHHLQDIDGKPMYAVLLHDEAGQRAMPVWIGQFEAEFIAIGLQKIAVPRPLTFSFMAQLLEATGATLEEVQVSALKNETYYATVRLRTGETVREVDAHPSDALALAIQTGASVYVSEEILGEAGVSLPAEINGAAPGKGLVNITKEIEARLQSRGTMKKDVSELEKSQQELISYVFGSKNI